MCEEFTREFEVLWMEYNECKFNQERILHKMGISELQNIKNDKTQQGSLRVLGEIGSNETIKTFPPSSIKNPDYRKHPNEKQISIEKKLIQDIF